MSRWIVVEYSRGERYDFAISNGACRDRNLVQAPLPTCILKYVSQAFLQLFMKALRFLPWTLSASAFFEHSSDFAVRCCFVLAAFFGAAAGVAAAGAAAAGAVGAAGVWANTGAVLKDNAAAMARA